MFIISSFNINKNDLSLQIIKHKKHHYMWHLKSKSWLGVGTKYGGVNQLMGSHPTPLIVFVYIGGIVDHHCLKSLLITTYI
jgi:hypothetical protein